MSLVMVTRVRDNCQWESLAEEHELDYDALLDDAGDGWLVCVQSYEPDLEGFAA